jgi:hypothetical protein
MPDEVGAMFQKFAQAPAIIMNMRGYPHGTAWPMTPYLNARKETQGALFLQPLVEQGFTGRRTQFVQPLVQNPAIQPYAGKVIVLIDDRAISQAEHSCLFYAVRRSLLRPVPGRRCSVASCDSNSLPRAARLTKTEPAERSTQVDRLRRTVRSWVMRVRGDARVASREWP